MILNEIIANNAVEVIIAIIGGSLSLNYLQFNNIIKSKVDNIQAKIDNSALKIKEELRKEFEEKFNDFEKKIEHKDNNHKYQIGLITELIKSKS
jgi:hypothetical protein